MTLERVLSDPSGDKAYEHVVWLTDNVPNRQSGSPNEHRAAGYFAGYFIVQGGSLRICRELTPAGFQVTPRWLQDSYGLSDLKMFIPFLGGVEDLGRL